MDQENKKELLAIRDKQAAAGKVTSTISLRTANCKEKLAYFNEMLKTSMTTGNTTAHQLNQLGIDKDLYGCNRIKNGLENNERLMK